MKTIDVKCATCDAIYEVSRQESLPKNVTSIRTSYCHQCEGEGERVETYVYKQKKEKSTYVDNDKQERLL